MGSSEEYEKGSSVAGPVKMRKVVIDGNAYSTAETLSFFSGKLIFFKVQFLNLFLQFVEGLQNVINLYG
jgi:hypothetical protein